jgi:hypothetical protein
MEAMCGAIGEVAQICVMYPLETIKVRRSSSKPVASLGVLSCWLDDSNPTGCLSQ